MLESEYMISVLNDIKLLLTFMSIVSWAVTLVFALIATITWIVDEEERDMLKRILKTLVIISPITLILTAVVILVPW